MQVDSVTDIVKSVLKKFIDKSNGDDKKIALILEINKALCKMIRTDWQSADVEKMKLGEVGGDYEATETMPANHVANQLNDLLRHLIDVENGEKLEIVTEDLDALYWAIAILRGIEE